MSLSAVLKQQLFRHSFCSKCQPYYVIYQRDQHKFLERCYIDRKPVFFSDRTGIRLLSISLNKCNIISRLTSYFIKEKIQVNKPSKDMPDNHSNVNSDVSTPVKENSENLQPKQKWKSLLDKLQVSSLYNSSSPVSVELKEDASSESDLRKRLNFQKEINESAEMFIQKYNKDLDLILKKADPTSVTKKTPQKVRKHKSKDSESKADVMKEVKYPVIKTKNTIPVKTDNYEKTKRFLQSLGIPYEELEHYPNIQEMDKDTILTCIDKLKEMGIYVVFSLFLIDRIAFQHKLNKKASTLMRKKTKVPLMSFRQVKAYVELCQLLEKPDLDIRNLLEQLAKMGHYCDMLHLHKKVKKLREVGATAKDIWSNLEILLGYDFFDDKIELYKKSQLVGQGPFPVHLFLAKGISSFKEQLVVGSEMDAVAKLLNVSVVDVQGCWGFQNYNTSKLQYKVNMCLAAGISKKEIFNNLGELISFPVEQCHAVTNCFRSSGLPVSVFVLREMVHAAKLNGHESDHGHRNKSLHDGNTVEMCTDSCRIQPEEDWIGELRILCPEDIQAPAKNNDFGFKKMLSTKKQKRRILDFIEHLIQLDGAMVTTMHECSVNVSAVEMLDVQKNLDYLISKEYTRDDIAKCPLILAHPHRDLLRVVSETDHLILLQLQSISVPSSVDSFSALLSTSPPPAFSSTVCGNAEEQQVEQDAEFKIENPYVFRHNLLANPEQRLNVFQYFLEKENSFSLGEMH